MNRSANSTVMVNQLLFQLEHPHTKRVRRQKQPVVERSQVKKSMRLKWKDPGFCGVQFSKAPIIRPKILNEWERDRINMATRSYKTPKYSKPYRFDEQSREFPKVGFKIYPTKFQRYLKQVESEAEDLKFKEKRTKTEGLQTYLQTLKSKSNQSSQFKPVSTTTTLFGFTSSKKEKRFSNPHVKTLAI